jgi:hypothetical protein
MAYNRDNYLKRISSILKVYNDHKEADKPDSFILRTVFPKHNIFISYRTWMNIKHRDKITVSSQPTLFD